VQLKEIVVALITLLTLYGVEARADSFVFIDVQGSVIISTSVDGGPPILRYGPVYNLSGPGLSVFNHTIPNNNAGSVEARDTFQTATRKEAAQSKGPCPEYCLELARSSR